MVNTEFHRLRKKLDERHFFCKTFYDFYMNKVELGTNEVYLKKEVDWIILDLKKVFMKQEEEIKRLKTKLSEQELEIYKLNKMKRRKK